MAPPKKASRKQNLSSPRVLLRHPIAADGPEYVALRTASRKHLEPWDSVPVGAAPDINYGPDAFERALRTSRLELSMRFLIVIKQTGALAGSVGISNITRGAFMSCTIGYWIGKAYVGQGFMTEALALSVRFIFTRLNLHRVEANIIPTNKPSTALVKRLGFRFEGLAKNYLRIAGKWQDHSRWAMTLEDYQRLKKSKTIPFAHKRDEPVDFTSLPRQHTPNDTSAPMVNCQGYFTMIGPTLDSSHGVSEVHSFHTSG